MKLWKDIAEYCYNTMGEWAPNHSYQVVTTRITRNNDAGDAAKYRASITEDCCETKLTRGEGQNVIRTATIIGFGGSIAEAVADAGSKAIQADFIEDGVFSSTTNARVIAEDAEALEAHLPREAVFNGDAVKYLGELLRPVDPRKPVDPVKSDITEAYDRLGRDLVVSVTRANKAIPGLALSIKLEYSDDNGASLSLLRVRDDVSKEDALVMIRRIEIAIDKALLATGSFSKTIKDD